MDLLHTDMTHVWSTPHTPLLCLPFHHRCWHEIRTVWVACRWNVRRMRDKFGLHLNVIRTNSAQKKVAFVWNIEQNRDKCGLHWHVIRANSGNSGCIGTKFGRCRLHLDGMMTEFGASSGSFCIKSGVICHGGHVLRCYERPTQGANLGMLIPPRAHLPPRQEKLPRLLLKHDSL